MINIKIENVSDTKTRITAEFHVKGTNNAVDEFTAVLTALEEGDRAIFAVAMLKFLDSRVKKERNDEE